MSIGQIKKLQRNGLVEHEISIISIPRRTLVSNKILEDEGVLGDVSVSELPLYFLALEDDVLSLELESSFSDLYLVCQAFSISSKMSNFNSEKIPRQFYSQPKLSCKSSSAMASFLASSAKAIMLGNWQTSCFVGGKN